MAVAPAAAYTATLSLRDDSDFEYAVRWTNDAGVAYDINAGRLVIRATEDAATALIDKTATIDASEWATFVILASEVQAANFEDARDSVWAVQLTRASDGRKWVAVAGTVTWQRGVVR